VANSNDVVEIKDGKPGIILLSIAGSIMFKIRYSFVVDDDDVDTGEYTW